MYRERISRLTARLRQKNIDALAIVPGAGLRYLTGLVIRSYERLTLLLIPSDDRPPCMVLPEMEVAQVRALSQTAFGSDAFLHFFAWTDADGPDAALQAAINHVLPGRRAEDLRIAVEYPTMRVWELRSLEAALFGMQAVDATPLLSDLRMVKDAYELEAMQEAVTIVETALRRTIEHIRPGVTERHLATIWAHEMITAGAEGESFESIVASGPNSAHPHHTSGDRPFAAGDIIILDGGACVRGYVSDITRVVALGTPDPTARHMYDLVLAANAAARAAMRPDIAAAEIDRAARQVIEQGGYGEFFLHRTGHGLGIECHEPPDIVAGNQQPLPVGTTFTIEPGIYIAGMMGVRIEDDVLMTDTGGESLTTFERDLIVVPV